MPAELVALVADGLGQSWPMGRDEATALREEFRLDKVFFDQVCKRLQKYIWWF